MTTGDGGIAIYLPSDFAAELDAHTGDGSIRSDLPTSAEAEGNSDKEHRTLKGRIGAGGRLLRIRTGDGGQSESRAASESQRHKVIYLESS